MFNSVARQFCDFFTESLGSNTGQSRELPTMIERGVGCGFPGWLDWGAGGRGFKSRPPDLQDAAISEWCLDFPQ